MSRLRGEKKKEDKAPDGSVMRSWCPSCQIYLAKRSTCPLCQTAAIQKAVFLCGGCQGTGWNSKKGRCYICSGTCLATTPHERRQPGEMGPVYTPDD